MNWIGRALIAIVEIDDAAASERLPLEQDRREVRVRLECIQRIVADPRAGERLRDDQGWFSGSA